MKKVLTLCVLLGLASASSAQILEMGLYFNPFSGSGTAIKQTANSDGSTQYSEAFSEDRLGVIGPYAGYYVPLVSPNRSEFSFGIDGRARLLIWVDDSQFGQSMSSEMQLLFMPSLRYGSMAYGDESEFVFGFAVEAGVMLSTFSYAFNALPDQEKGTMLRPNIRISGEYNGFQLGLDYTLGSFKADYIGNVSDIPRIEIKSALGFSLGWRF